MSSNHMHQKNRSTKNIVKVVTRKVQGGKTETIGELFWNLPMQHIIVVQSQRCSCSVSGLWRNAV
jgi:hypothetical protein